MTIEHQLQVPKALATYRIDQAVSSLLPQYSRAKLQGWIRAGQLTVDGEPVRQKDRLSGGEEVLICAEEATTEVVPQDIPLDLVYEDASLLVVNKPPGLVVHPGAGNKDGTLMNALLYRDPKAAQLPRAGIVHRLDKGTSGLLLVARTLQAQTRLVSLLQERRISRHYYALVYGLPAHRQGRIDAPIARHPLQRTLMAVRQSGKPAITHYEVQEAFAAAALLHCRLETGRTHQIRVHAQSIGHPLIGDTTYGGHFRSPKAQPQDQAAQEAALATLRAFQRPALHARELILPHPTKSETMHFEVAPPSDFAALHQALAALG